MTLVLCLGITLFSLKSKRSRKWRQRYGYYSIFNKNPWLRDVFRDKETGQWKLSLQSSGSLARHSLASRQPVLREDHKPLLSLVRL